MNNKILSKRGLIFALLFIALSVVGLRMNFSKLVGAENQFFTMFQFWGPIAGGFLGSTFGIITVAAAQIIDFVFVGKEASLLNILRLSPMLFAAYYFSQYKNRKLDDKVSMAIPVLAILAFWLHPVGQQAWYFALFWTIPIIMKFFPDKLLLRSLGATFSAHAVGGAIWVWSVPMTAAQWNMLIPVVVYERALFAIGIAASYVVFTNVLNVIDKATQLEIGKFINIEKSYVIKS